MVHVLTDVMVYLFVFSAAAFSYFRNRSPNPVTIAFPRFLSLIPTDFSNSNIFLRHAFSTLAAAVFNCN